MHFTKSAWWRKWYVQGFDCVWCEVWVRVSARVAACVRMVGFHAGASYKMHIVFAHLCLPMTLSSWWFVLSLCPFCTFFRAMFGRKVMSQFCLISLCFHFHENRPHLHTTHYNWRTRDETPLQRDCFQDQRCQKDTKTRQTITMKVSWANINEQKRCVFYNLRPHENQPS